MKLKLLFTFLALVWAEWYIFFAMGTDLVELVFVLLGIDYNEVWFILINISFISAFLIGFLWLRTRSKREKRCLERRVP